MKPDRAQLKLVPHGGQYVEVPAKIAQAAALKPDQQAAAASTALRPSLKREHVKGLLSAKKEETRERRLAQTLAFLRAPKKERPRRRFD